MKQVLFLILFFKICDGFGQSHSLIYIENKGQWSSNILYKATLPQGTVYLENSKMTINLRESPAHAKVEDPNKLYKGFAYNIEFVNSNPKPTLLPKDKVDEYFNYFIGDSSHWRGNCKGFQAIIYQDIYPHIDLMIYSSHQSPKYTFIIKEKGNVGAINLRYNGVDSLYKDSFGNISFNTHLGLVKDLKPISFWVRKGEKSSIASQYTLFKNEVKFDIGKIELKSQQSIEIDPQIVFSTYSGSISDNFGCTATYDQSGNLYGGGTVFADQYPTTLGAYDISFNNTITPGVYVADIAITKFSANGSTRLYSTYLGGNSADIPHSLIVDANNRLIVLGTTSSTNYPVTTNAYQKIHNGGPNLGSNISSLSGLGISYPNGADIVLTKFNASGTALVGSTYYGGNGSDGIGISPNLVKNYGDNIRGEVLLDNFDNIFIATCSNSTNLPTLTNSAFKTNSGGYDGIIVKFNTNLSSVLGFTYIGGSGDDALYDAFLNSNNDIIAAGGTTSANLPTSSNAYMKTYQGNTDGFLTTFDNNLSTKTNTSFYGTNAYDQIYFVEYDKQNKVYVFGQTDYNAGTFYVQNATYSNGNKGQFISSFTTDLSSRVQSTTFGAGNNNPDISPTAFLVDYCNQIYVGGWGSTLGGLNTYQLSTTGLPVTPNAFQSTTQGGGFYFMTLTGTLSQLNYATMFGGVMAQSDEHVDGGTSRFDKKGYLYHAICSGCNGRQDLPIYPNAASVVSGTNKSPNCNLGVIKFDFGKAIVADFSVNTTCAPDNVIFTNLSYTVSNTPTYSWTFSNGQISTVKNPSILISTPGTYTARLIVTDLTSCNLADTITKTFYVLGNRKDTLATKTICIGGSVQIGFQKNYDTSYSIRWTPANTLDDATLLAPFASPTNTTLYQAIVTKGNCIDTFTQTVLIEQPFPLTIQGPSKTCLNITKQYIATHYNTGSYSWSSNNGFLSNSRDTAYYKFTIFPSTISVSYTSQNGCLSLASYTVDLGNDSYKITGDSIICPDKQFTISATLLAGTTYKWSTGETTNTISHTIPSSTTYQVTITDTNGCITIDTFRVLTLDTIEVQFLNLQTTNCKFDTLYLNMKVLPLTNYIWTPNSVIISGQGTPNIKAWITQNTTFTVVANLTTNNCPVTKIINIVKDTSFVKIKGPNLYCKNDTLKLTANYDAKYTYTWLPNNYISQSNNIASYKFINDQWYSCSILVKNSTCTYSDSIYIKRIKLLDDLTLTATPSKVKYGKTVQLDANSINAISYLWSPSAKVSNSFVHNPTSKLDTTTTFYCTVSDSMHCKSSDSIVVPVYYEICDNPEVFVPNSFTPNNDGKNDVMYVRGDNIVKVYFAIYDRWGQMLFETYDQNKGWDGTFKNNEMEPGVFAYYINAVCIGGATLTKSGNITLLK